MVSRLKQNLWMTTDLFNYSVFHSVRNFMKVMLKVIVAITLSSSAFAETLEGFDYIRGKIQGQMTISEQWVKLQFTGDAAEAIYYQMRGGSEPSESIVFFPGMTKQHIGLMCSQITTKNTGKKGRFECFANINLKTGKLEKSDNICFENQSLKMEGRVTVENHWLRPQITGKSAENIYNQMLGKTTEEIYPESGDATVDDWEKTGKSIVVTTKQFPGFSCVKTMAYIECFIDINLKTGQPEESESMYPESDFDAAMDAKGNKFPRSK
jgi:hypothetical protein